MMRTILKGTFLTFMMLVMSMSAVQGVVSAQDFENPLGDSTEDVREFFEVLVTEIVVPIGAVVVAFFIIWSGFLFVTSGGDPGKIQAARTTFTWTMVGAAVLLGAWAITLAIEATVCQIAPDTCDGTI